MTVSNQAEQAALIALLKDKPKSTSYADIARAVSDHNSAMTVLQTVEDQGSLFDPADTSHGDTVADARRDLSEWLAEGLIVTTVIDQSYPAQLREIHEMPPILFGRGSLLAADRAVSVVGSRHASEAGHRFATEVAHGLVEANISVVSGLAAGIDTAAHTAALAASGRTVAVIGTGIRRAYPAANAKLQEQIAHVGLLISQFWPDAPPGKHTFPMRNATMSGYGRATIIVEAGEHSGTRGQARMAVAHGRAVILTERVAQNTTWGKELTNKPGVRVARTASDAVAAAVEASRPLSELAAEVLETQLAG